MRLISGLFKIVRPLNLLFIILAQYFIRHFVIIPPFEIYGIEPTLDNLHFALLVFSTVCIAAAGYAINDYFDVKIDYLNKPKKVYVDREIERKKVIILHWMLNGVGVVLGAYLAYFVGNLKYAMIFPLTAGLLWFYSTAYKKQLIVGNVIVAFLTSLILLIVLLFEPKLFDLSIFGMRQITLGILYTILGYGFFAFWTSLIREIIKDMEDVYGDSQFGCSTIPIKIGISKTKIITAVLILIQVLLIGVIMGQYFADMNHGRFLYILFAIQTPLLYVLYLMKDADKSADFRTMSKIVKLVMLTGLLSMPVFQIIQ